MKKTKLFVALAFVLGAVALVGCNGKSQPTQKEKEPFVLKGDTWLYLNVRNTNTMKADDNEIKPLPKDQNLTPRQIVTVACDIEALLKDNEGRRGATAVSDRMRDFENNRIKIDPYNIIEPRPFMVDGKKVEKFVLVERWITNRDVVLHAFGTPELGLEPGEIIAYIPNATMEKAEKAIREAWAKGDNEAVYKFFNDAYTFIPIRKGAYEKLKEEGKL
ncbi:hypothetical protein HMPREF1869_00077 [Bacteroidales bacterium KA00251]|nr:hypothetical protein HMPREF1869_00077 [Bacteroidales bacterium KA00251]